MLRRDLAERLMNVALIDFCCHRDGTMKAESSGEEVERLLHCLQRGLSPLTRTKTNHISRSPRTPIAVSCRSTDGLVTPDLKPELQQVTKEVTPGVFYGSPIGRISRKPPQLLRLLHEIRRDLAAEGYSISRRTIWATFPKQDQAVQFLESHANRDIALFTYQDHLSGQRRFLATTYKEFWCRYDCIPEENRHHYEIITGGSPCHLYLDLEYNVEVNPKLNGVIMVDILLEKIADALLDIYNISYDFSWTVELDSTTKEKFSRHVIIRIPKVAFKDNSHVGAFVSELCRRLDNIRDHDERVNQLYVIKGESRQECHSHLFLDQAVYSRNRSFRLPFSSKAGKSSQLVASGRFHCMQKSKYKVFMDSLVCRVDEDCERLLTFDSGRGDGRPGMELNVVSHMVSGLSKARSYAISGSSPFPKLDIFVESIACVGGIPGRIRSWYWFSEHGVVVYNMTGNRYCENIGRQHKGNHVMYIVDLRTNVYYQKCHDPDCRGYRSPLRPIPWHVVPSSFPDLTAQKSLEEDRSFGKFSSLTLSGTSELQNRVPCSIEEGNGCETLADEAAWWKEVISLMEGLEKGHPLKHAAAVGLPECFSGDESADWWGQAEQEAANFESFR